MAYDGSRVSNTATVTITVNQIDTPVAVADSYTTPAGSTLTTTAAQGVLSNDTDPLNPGASLTAKLVRPPANGKLTLNSDGSFVYTPGFRLPGKR